MGHPPTARGAGPAPGTDPFDPEFTRTMVDEAFGPALEHYFRPRLVGSDNLPLEGPVVLAANHSGNSFPYDAMALDALVWRREGRPGTHATGHRKLRPVFEKELATTRWMRPFGIDDFWRRGGGVDMTFDNFDRLLARGERVLYFPEGVPGIGKGFWRRYQLQRFSTSFVVLAARHRAPVVPVSIVNAEWTIPFCFTLPWLDRLSERFLGVPFVPLPAAPLGLLFPWLWYLSLPVRMTFVFGRPIDMAARLEAAGVSDLDDLEMSDRATLRQVADEVRAEMQVELDRHVASFGRRPYDARSLLRHLWRHRRLAGRILPIGWALAFVCRDRDRRRPPARNRLHAILRDFDLGAFYLPFGWPLLSLARRLRRPPYGYRGLTRKERRTVEGNFHWRLAERPLPPLEPSAEALVEEGQGTS